ncbi:hypothetical protein LINGRAHAP2_LOCUS24720 [Linum grandiflorum]
MSYPPPIAISCTHPLLLHLLHKPLNRKSASLSFAPTITPFSITFILSMISTAAYAIHPPSSASSAALSTTSKGDTQLPKKFLGSGGSNRDLKSTAKLDRRIIASELVSPFGLHDANRGVRQSGNEARQVVKVCCFGNQFLLHSKLLGFGYGAGSFCWSLIQLFQYTNVTSSELLLAIRVRSKTGVSACGRGGFILIGDSISLSLICLYMPMQNPAFGNRVICRDIIVVDEQDTGNSGM